MGRLCRSNSDARDFRKPEINAGMNASRHYGRGLCRPYCDDVAVEERLLSEKVQRLYVLQQHCVFVPKIDLDTLDFSFA